MNTRGLWLQLTATLVLSACAFSQAASTQANTGQQDAQALVKQGRALNNQGKHEEALAIYRRVLQNSPNDFDANLAAGVTLDLQGKYAEARKHIAKAIEASTPENRAQALRTMAMSYAFERNGAEATRYQQQVFDARMARQDFEGAAEIANELARVLLESGDVDAASKWYQTGHQTALRTPSLPPARKDLWDFRWEHAQARIAARRGQRAEAQKHVAAAKSILDKGTNPEQAPFYPYLTGYVAFHAGDYKTALAELQKGEQRDPFVLSLIAQAYEKSGNQAQAMEYYRRVLASNSHGPTNAFARPLAMQKVGGTAATK